MTYNDFLIASAVFFGYLVILLKIRNLILRRLSRRQMLLTAFIGTPIHETSHALVHFLSGHRIREIKFFQLNSANGTLGYVSYEYNPKNIIHQLGRMISGIAPLFGGLVGCYIVIFLVFPFDSELLVAIHSYIDRFSFSLPSVSRNTHQLISQIHFIVTSFSWTFINALIACAGCYLCIAISLHSVPSFEDIKSTIPGFFLSFLMVVPVLLIFPEWRAEVTQTLFDVSQVILSLTVLLLTMITFYLIVSAFGCLMVFLFRQRITEKRQ